MLGRSIGSMGAGLKGSVRLKVWKEDRWVDRQLEFMLLLIITRHLYPRDLVLAQPSRVADPSLLAQMVRGTLSYCNFPVFAHR